MDLTDDSFCKCVYATLAMRTLVINYFKRSSKLNANSGSE